MLAVGCLSTASRVQSRQFSRTRGSFGGQVTLTEQVQRARTRVPAGVLLVGFGIAFLTLNERRDVRMTSMQERARAVCQQLDASSKRGARTPPDDNAMVHCCDWLAAERGPTDSLLHVTPAAALRLVRTTSMYQWHETKQETTGKDKDGRQVRSVSYSYRQDWSPRLQHVESAEHEGNPPPGLQLGRHTFEAKALRMGQLGVLLGPAFVAQIDDFEPLPLDAASNCSPDRARAAVAQRSCRVEQAPDGRTALLFSASTADGRSALLDPRVGDIRVDYDYVPEAQYTALAKWQRDGSLQPWYDDQARCKSLADDGEVRVSDHAAELFDTVGHKTFLLPEPLIRSAEASLLSVAPIQIAFIKKGRLSVDDAFDALLRNEHNVTMLFRFGGFLICVVGADMAMSFLKLLPVPLPIVARGPLLVGAAIALESMHVARQQLGKDASDDWFTRWLTTFTTPATTDHKQDQQSKP